MYFATSARISDAEFRSRVYRRRRRVLESQIPREKRNKTRRLIGDFIRRNEIGELRTISPLMAARTINIQAYIQVF